MRKLIYIFLLFSLTANAQDTILDCFGTVAPTSWLGDGFCDNGSYTWNGNVIDFNCEEFGYDGEDCPLPIDTVPGCTDMLALNYVPEANFNDGSCVYPVPGCTDPLATNYNANATVNDGSCIYTPTPGPTTGTPIPGCTDPLATNFNPQATVNDGSCVYPTIIDECKIHFTNHFQYQNPVYYQFAGETNLCLLYTSPSPRDS